MHAINQSSKTSFKSIQIIYIFFLSYPIKTVTRHACLQSNQSSHKYLYTRTYIPTYTPTMHTHIHIPCLQSNQSSHKNSLDLQIWQKKYTCSKLQYYYRIWREISACSGLQCHGHSRLAVRAMPWKMTPLPRPMPPLRLVLPLKYKYQYKFQHRIIHEDRKEG